jgi:hypothetical protein
MAATVSISESNGLTPTVTASVTNVNMGSTEAVNLVAADYPITAGNNSFEKWNRFNVTAMGGSSKIKTLKVWASAGLSANCTHKTNCRESSYDGAQVYDTSNGPLATDRSATYDYAQTMPTSTPSGANIGIGGSLTGELTATGYSDYIVMQIQTTASAVAGTSITMNYQYDEVA